LVTMGAKVMGQPLVDKGNQRLIYRIDVDGVALDVYEYNPPTREAFVIARPVPPGPITDKQIAAATACVKNWQASYPKTWWNLSALLRRPS
jgi:hypothetical protein